MSDRALRRNDVVMEHDGWFYGRVVRVIDSETVMVIDCGKRLQAFLMEDLRLTNYTGYDGPHGFVPMPSLRRLKQQAACYDPVVWRSYRRRHGMDDYGQS